MMAMMVLLALNGLGVLIDHQILLKENQEGMLPEGKRKNPKVVAVSEDSVAMLLARKKRKMSLSLLVDHQNSLEVLEATIKTKNLIQKVVPPVDLAASEIMLVLRKNDLE